MQTFLSSTAIRPQSRFARHAVSHEHSKYNHFVSFLTVFVLSLHTHPATSSRTEALRRQTEDGWREMTTVPYKPKF